MLLLQLRMMWFNHSKAYRPGKRSLGFKKKLLRKDSQEEYLQRHTGKLRSSSRYKRQHAEISGGLWAPKCSTSRQAKATPKDARIKSYKEEDPNFRGVVKKVFCGTHQKYQIQNPGTHKKSVIIIFTKESRVKKRGELFFQQRAAQCSKADGIKRFERRLQPQGKR